MPHDHGERLHHPPALAAGRCFIAATPEERRICQDGEPAWYRTLNLTGMTLVGSLVCGLAAAGRKTADRRRGYVGSVATEPTRGLYVPCRGDVCGVKLRAGEARPWVPIGLGFLCLAFCSEAMRDYNV